MRKAATRAVLAVAALAILLGAADSSDRHRTYLAGTGMPVTVNCAAADSSVGVGAVCFPFSPGSAASVGIGVSDDLGVPGPVYADVYFLDAASAPTGDTTFFCSTVLADVPGDAAFMVVVPQGRLGAMRACAGEPAKGVVEGVFG
ncbi:MAG: hypothetical protein ACYDAY_10455 [Candidatus Dormibacteria bacterium]